jgi:hypothetical protein
MVLLHSITILSNKYKVNIVFFVHRHPLYKNEFFPSVMSRNQYQVRSSMLHFNDNTNLVPRGQDGYDQLFKIRPLVDALLWRFRLGIVPTRELSIDESMMAFKGRTSMIQYISTKRTRYTILILVSNNSSSKKAPFTEYSDVKEHQNFT